MRLLLALLIAFAAAGAEVTTQITKSEVTRATTPHDDAKPNSVEVPDVYAVEGRIERVVVLRFKYQTDLLGGIEKMVKEKGIRNAVFLSGVGSVRNYHVHAVSNRDFPSKNVFIRDSGTPADIISVNGYVVNGKVHAHMTLADGEKAWGGHIEPGNPVFTFAIITLGVLDPGADLSRVDDKTYR